MRTTPLSTLLFLLLFAGNSFAQTQVAGQLRDAAGQPLPAATVLLLQARDSALVKGCIAAADGAFRFENLSPGDYRVAASMIGYATLYSVPFALDNRPGILNVDPIVLQEDQALLGEVSVVAKRPLFEQKIDRLVINVENSITSAGGTALEVLARAPGVMVDRQNNAISLAGKNGVQVMINGKLKYMPATALVQMLAGMSADNIEKIEIITTPPANLDAEGNAGYINIVLKKNLDDGLNGSYAVSAGYGRGGIGSANLNFNFRQGKFNLFGDYGYVFRNQEQIFEINRSFDSEGKTTDTRSITYRDPAENNHNVRLGLDYQVTRKTLVGVLFSGYETNWVMDAMNDSETRVNGAIDSLVTIRNHEYHQMQHLAGNLNLQHNFSPDESLGFDFDYLHYRDDNPTDYTNTYRDAQGGFLFENRTRSAKLTPIGIAVGKADYTRKWSEKVKMEAGVKAVRSRFNNDVRVETLVDTDWQADPELTGNYDLREDIAAAYTAFDVQAGPKMNFKLGLRYEHTRSNLGSDQQANIVDRSYGNWFPSVFYGYNIDDNRSLNLAYSRRITRPTFNDMAPFVIFLDPSTFFSGNAALQPAISNNLSVSYRHKTVFLSLQFSHEDDAIAGFQSKVDTARNRLIIAAENLNSLKTLTFSLSFPVQVTKWWDLQINSMSNWQQANTIYDNAPLRVAQVNFMAMMTQHFKFTSSFSGELVGFYQSPSLFGTYTARPIYGMNAGLQLKFGEQGGTLNFGVDDVFNSFAWRSRSNLDDQHIRINTVIDFSQRTFKLTYARNFGSNKVKGARARSMAEEQGRVRQ